MALGLPTPQCIYAHSFWISEGKKMSKTLGNFIDLPLLEAYIARYGLDALRWYLLTQGLAESVESAGDDKQSDQVLRRLLDRLDKSLGLLPEVRQKLSEGK